MIVNSINDWLGAAILHDTENAVCLSPLPTTQPASVLLMHRRWVTVGQTSRRGMHRETQVTARRVARDFMADAGAGHRTADFLLSTGGLKGLLHNGCVHELSCS